MPDTFCALPFRHLTFSAEGKAQLCCMANEPITEHGAPMSLSVHTKEEIWNSAYVRNVRRAMLNGERVSACQVCYDSEAVSGNSYRTWIGLNPIPGERLTQADVKKSLGPGYRAENQPAFLKVELGNLCNLKCRMCFSSASSQIERDPVHSKWSGGSDPLHAVWQGVVARIGPEPRIGVRTSGLCPQEILDGALRRWTDGHAIFHVPLQAGTVMRSLDIFFHPNGIRGQHFQIVINGRPMMTSILRSANDPISIDLRGFREAEELTIEILSNKIVEDAGQPERGLPLSGLELRRELVGSTKSVRPQRLSSQLSADGPWYMDDHKLFDEVLKPTHELRRLNIAGGETFINQRFIEILDFLIDSGANHIHFDLPTNATHINDEIIQRLRSFPHIQLGLSLDGVGETYEYIRYPARWNVVEANVRKLLQSGFACHAQPVIQIYNVLRLPELYRYCDTLGIRVAEMILFEPARLAISILPPKARKAAAARLLRYCESECRIEDKSSRLSLVQHLSDLTSPADPIKIREFMIFTNDLDATRGQSFRRAHPELVELLAEDGFEWVDDTLCADGHYRNKPARERTYAWL
jgi:MoaA/NifB/PqqE/SkfB family radical SAM enzyme